MTAGWSNNVSPPPGVQQQHQPRAQSVHGAQPPFMFGNTVGPVGAAPTAVFSNAELINERTKVYDDKTALEPKSQRHVRKRPIATTMVPHASWTMELRVRIRIAIAIRMAGWTLPCLMS